MPIVTHRRGPWPHPLWPILILFFAIALSTGNLLAQPSSTSPSAHPSPSPSLSTAPGPLPQSENTPTPVPTSAPSADATPGPIPASSPSPTSPTSALPEGQVAPGKTDNAIEDLYAPDVPKKAEHEPAKKEDEAPPTDENPVLYISDTDNGRIVIMKGIAGAGFTSIGLPGYGYGRFLRPAQIWLDYAGRMYIADSGNDRVVRIDQRAEQGWTEVDGLSEPQGVAVDAAGTYVSDTKADRVLLYPDIVPGAKPAEVLTHPLLKRPGALWIDPQGAVYICAGEDPPGGRLFKTWLEKGIAEKPDGKAPEQRRWLVFEGDGLSGARFLPSSVVVNKGGIRLLDSSGQRFLSMKDMHGKNLRDLRTKSEGQWKLSRPVGMAMSKNGELYLADSGHDRILKMSADGEVLGEFEIANDDPATLLSNPSSIFVFSEAPAPAPKEEEATDGKHKGKSKGKAKSKTKITSQKASTSPTGADKND